MDKRDPKTKFEQQKNLHSKRPSTEPVAIGKLRDAGRIFAVQSFSIALSNSEAAIVLSIDDQEPMVIKLNPDVVLNLGLNLLKAGNQMEWFQVDIQDTDPPQPH